VEKLRTPLPEMLAAMENILGRKREDVFVAISVCFAEMSVTIHDFAPT
jgi:hypothetical protein